MAIVFNPSAKRIVLDRATVSADYLWSRWADWAAAGDNLKYLPAMSQLGGDPLDNDDPALATKFAGSYVFLENGWRVRPMEMDHDCEITGVLGVRGGGTPFVRTLGNFQVNTKYSEPVAVQGIATGGSSGPSAADIAAAVRAELAAELAKILILPTATESADAVWSKTLP